MHPTPALVSWMGLLAALTLGRDAGVIRAEVQADVAPSAAPLRLVVQSYEAPAGSHAVPRNARPLGSLQRAVTAEELRRGLVLDVPCVGAQGDAPLVVAWVEHGHPDLAFDGRTARPRRGSVIGFARGGDVSLQLRARSAPARSTKAA